MTKFSYFRELLAPKVRAPIEALSFSSEGYIRGKDKYGKDSDVVKAYNIEILELPVISGVNVKKTSFDILPTFSGKNGKISSSERKCVHDIGQAPGN